MLKQAQYKIKGMNRDLSFSAFNPEFAFENKNIRITPIEGNTLFSIVNEKGTLPLKLTGENISDNIIQGNVLGYSVINDILILFTTTSEKDSIYQIEIDTEDTLSVKSLYTGDLNFSSEHPIETLAIYENEDNVKVYWVDGYNQPRVINIKDTNKLNDNSFDFVPKIDKLGESIFFVQKLHTSGTFPAGVIQYCYTYYNKNRQETNIIEVSPLYYTSHLDRGGSPEESVTNSFNLTLTDLDTNFQYVRIYSILRTSLNATPICKVVANLEIPSEGRVSITDTGNLGYTIDPTDLLYIGGEVITANTITQKDNTLFLGNISVNKLRIEDGQNSIGEEVQKLVRYLQFDNNDKGDDADFSININNGSTGQYPYKNQLDLSSSEIKIFKYNETYRCGLQFQHETGKWSSPIWLGDVTNDIRPTGLYNIEDIIRVTTGKPHLVAYNIETLITSLINKGYRAVRPVIVYPTDNDRSCICQGVINPTVFNVGDRKDKTTFSQASWYFRPKLPYNINNLDFADFIEPRNKSENSIGGIVATKDYYYVHDDFGDFYTEISPKDAWTEFRHHYFIPHNRDTRAEIQSIEQYPTMTLQSYYEGNYTVDETPYIEGNLQYEDFPEMYAIDSALVTLNSPEIESNSINEALLANTKLRYIGIIPITGNTQDIDIITDTPGITNKNGTTGGYFRKVLYNKPNLSRLAGRRKLADYIWRDFVTKNSDNEVYFITYPWHREGSLNQERTSIEGYRSALLKNQKRSNLFFSTNTIYLDNTHYSEYSPKKPTLVRNDSFNRIKYPIKDAYEDIIYRGDVDNLIIPKFVDSGDFVIGNNIVRKSKGYYINRVSNSVPSLTMIDDRSKRNTNLEEEAYGIDPINIKYKSTPHIVLDHGFDGEDRLISPILRVGGESLNNEGFSPIYDTFYKSHSDYNESIDASTEINIDSKGQFTDGTPGYSWLWLAELYRDVPDNVKFGGTSKEAIENNNWVVAGDTYPLVPEDGLNIVWREGDHFYQRYDCLKTYPYTLEDTNSVVEILSFMCETRVNLDGRYDRNRAQSSNLVMTPNNFNLFNSVYSQKNNFFNYREVSQQYAEIESYLNQITWSKTKTFGETIDTWTNITLASILDLDGDKGRVEALRRLNNDIIAFQERGISQILYNDNVQLSTAQGVPIEIANSGKVQGKRYLSSSVGCNNKWSICESPSGLYFIDDITKGIYLFNGNLTNLTSKLGFSTWAKENFSNLEPITLATRRNNYLSYYDSIEGEVLFLGKYDSLVYSESLGSFTSFYDYINNSIPIKMKDRTIMFGDMANDENIKFYGYHEGEYNNFYGVLKPFYTTIVVNPEPTKDKIFNNIEFRADTWRGNEYLPEETFDNISVKNEYQSASSILKNIKDMPSILKKKFRIWRANLPRDGRQRIRNPWVKITLSKNSNDSHRTELHDIIVSYFQ